MSNTDFNIQYVAHLARIDLSPEEESTLSHQLDDILAYTQKLQEADISQVAPMAHPFPLVNVTRDDVVTPSLSQKEALQNAPLKANGLFMVPKIVE